MSRSAEFIMKLIDMVTPGLKSMATQAGVSISKMDGFTASLDKVHSHSLQLSSLQNVLGNANSALDEITAPGKAFNNSMAEMEAITGLSGKQLDILGEKARKTAVDFGGDAAAQTESYKLILSQLTPDLAKSSEAMDLMGRNVAMLSKTMKGDAQGATEGLTVAMNQYGVSMDDPMKAAESMTAMMDMMAMAARAGSAEVPDIAASIKVAGLTAKNAGIEFAEFNGAIEVLAMGAIKGAEAGTALRNVVSIMGKGDWIPPHTLDAMKEAGVDINKLRDTTIPFAARLDELKKIQGDAALVGKVFGMENKNAAMQLLGNTDMLRNYTKQIENSNGATADMASTIMNSYGERMGRISAVFKDIGISIFGATQNFLPFLQTSVYGLDLYTRLSPILTLAKGAVVSFLQSLITGTAAVWRFVVANSAAAVGLIRTAAQFALTGLMAVGSFVLGLVTATASMWGLNVAMTANPIGLIIVGIAACIAAVVAIVYYWDDLKGYLIDFAKFFLKLNIFYWLIELVDYFFPGVMEKIVGFFQGIWDWIVGWIGKVGEILGVMFDGFTGAEIDLGVTKQSEMTMKEESVAGKGQAEISKRESKVEGDSGKARIVNVRFDKIEITNKFEGDALDTSLEEFGEKFTRFLVSSVRDGEVILSNG